MRPGESPKVDAERHERVLQAVECRKSGMGYHQIAKEMGCSVSTAHAYVHKYFGELKQLATEELEQVRALELARLDKMLERLCAIIHREEYIVVNDEGAATESADEAAIKAIVAATKLMERRAKLLGLDAPAKQVIEQRQADMSDQELAAELRTALSNVEGRLGERKMDS